MKSRIFSPLLAGVLIGIAGAAYLSTSLTSAGAFAGAVLFGFGLMGVVGWKLDLYTGRAGFWSGRMIKRLLPVLLLNIVGCAMVALVALKPATVPLAMDIVEKRLAASSGMLFINSALCGMIMTTAVRFAREGNWWPLIFGVPAFIMCGFPHCIADVYYWTVALLEGMAFQTVLSVYLITVAGNYAGCNIPRLIPGFEPDKASAVSAEKTRKVTR